MEKKNIYACLFGAIFLFFACKDDDIPVLKGDIKGTVSIFDCYGYSLSDKSGVQVQLTGDNISYEKYTDIDGQYSFEDLPFGNYRIKLVKENFVESILDFRLSHIGGEVPTLTSQTLNEIPGYKLEIDSISGYGRELFIYAIAIETAKPIISAPIFANCFFGKSPDVSCENFEHNFIIQLYPGDEINDYIGAWWWWNVAYNSLKDYTGTIYCRIYPQSYYHEIYPENESDPFEVRLETMGKPSEVFSFTLGGPIWE